MVQRPDLRVKELQEKQLVMVRRREELRCHRQSLAHLPPQHDQHARVPDVIVHGAARKLAELQQLPVHAERQEPPLERKRAGQPVLVGQAKPLRDELRKLWPLAQKLRRCLKESPRRVDGGRQKGRLRHRLERILHPKPVVHQVTRGERHPSTVHGVAQEPSVRDDKQRHHLP